MNCVLWVWRLEMQQRSDTFRENCCNNYTICSSFRLFPCLVLFVCLFPANAWRQCSWLPLLRLPRRLAFFHFLLFFRQRCCFWCVTEYMNHLIRLENQQFCIFSPLDDSLIEVMKFLCRGNGKSLHHSHLIFIFMWNILLLINDKWTLPLLLLATRCRLHLYHQRASARSIRYIRLHAQTPTEPDIWFSSVHRKISAARCGRS